MLSLDPARRIDIVCRNVAIAGVARPGQRAGSDDRVLNLTRAEPEARREGGQLVGSECARPVQASRPQLTPLRIRCIRELEPEERTLIERAAWLPATFGQKHCRHTA